MSFWMLPWMSGLCSYYVNQELTGWKWWREIALAEYGNSSARPLGLI